MAMEIEGQAIKTGQFKERLVHLDLKGAIPSIHYLKQIFPLLKKWGATGILIEYEDVFPYSGHLKSLSAPHAYSVEEVREIIEIAVNNDLSVIPLVQTFGHMEFVLKHEEFASYREIGLYPMAICPCNSESLLLLQSMIDQVFSLHTGIQYFHIGGDEVYHLGLCKNCTTFMTSNSLKKEELFFYHVKRVAKYIKENYPGVTCIIWDDMFRYSELSILLRCDLANLVEPMVWHYLPNFVLPDDLWDKLSAIFPVVWVASAFKGATGPRANVTNISYHLNNHISWLETSRTIGSKFKNVKGIALTGWQRYDHYATLCELLPHGLPSLALCLRLIQQETLSQDDIQATSKELGFTNSIPLNPLADQQVPVCSFPGSDIYSLVIEFAHADAACREFFTSEYLATWMSDYNVARRFVNPIHIEPLLAKSMQLLGVLRSIDSKGMLLFRDVFSSCVVFDEWKAVNLSPVITKLEDFVNKSRSVIVPK